MAACLKEIQFYCHSYLNEITGFFIAAFTTLKTIVSTVA